MIDPSYAEALEEIRAVIDGEPDLIANLANIVALLREHVPRASWIGFYITRPRGEANELVLGPFQGKVACVRIPFGKGVCGASAIERRTIVVPDVHAFPGHIACDAGSRSEIVVPIIASGQVVAVLDLDSYELAAFDDTDAAGLAPIAALAGSLAW